MEPFSRLSCVVLCRAERISGAKSLRPHSSTLILGFDLVKGYSRRPPPTLTLRAGGLAVRLPAGVEGTRPADAPRPSKDPRRQALARAEERPSAADVSPDFVDFEQMPPPFFVVCNRSPLFITRVATRKQAQLPRPARTRPLISGAQRRGRPRQNSTKACVWALRLLLLGVLERRLPLRNGHCEKGFAGFGQGEPT